MSNRDLLIRFCDGPMLTPTEHATLRNANLIGDIGEGRFMVTAAGSSLLTGVSPPGDSASCPDEDSYWPRHSPGDWVESVTATPSLVTGEADPLGKHQHETGAKLDAGKVRLGLVLGAFSNALVEVGKVGTYGAQKYTDNGWLDVPKGKARYTDALLRHIFAEANESHDPDTNLHHAAHAAWNALARLELILRKRGDE